MHDTDGNNGFASAAAEIKTLEGIDLSWPWL